MSNQKGNSKRQRTHRISQGIHGATHHPLDAVSKVLLGKGQMQSIKEVPCLRGWSGVHVDPAVPWSRKNVAENRVLYPHLFPEDER